MLRQRLVRQSAVNISSGSDSTMPATPPFRRRRNSQDSKMFRQLSSESMDNLIYSKEEDRATIGSRRHSVACGVLYVDVQKPTLKSAFSSAVRRMSDACSMLSSAPSSTYNLSITPPHPKKKEAEVILPPVLGTFRQNRLPPAVQTSDKKKCRNMFQVNRRFSTDLPPPSYSDVTSAWKQPITRQKLLSRQNEIAITSTSLTEDDDLLTQHE